MNIFILDKDPYLAAQYLCDIHVRKMLIESVQLLTNGYCESQLFFAPRTQNENIRKYSHYNHPCSIWVRQSYDNWKWLRDHAHGIYTEFLHRFNKDHFCHGILTWMNRNTPNSVPYGDLTPFALAMPEQYKNPCAVQSYRDYYINDKRVDKNGKWMLRYSNRDVPDWMPLNLKDLIYNQSETKNRVETPISVNLH